MKLTIEYRQPGICNLQSYIRHQTLYISPHTLSCARIHLSGISLLLASK
ncbi:MAG TPA: hypothetical protein VK787_14560 [Puia sp.]|nr:hypothetical protein [Puia sp.]